MILIKSAQIIDGSGSPGRRADVLLNSDRISAIGDMPNRKADMVIDGLGLFLAPGFIDIQANSDHYLSIFIHPDQKDFLLQGVTTIIGGHCGSSLAPLLYGTLESIRKWGDPNQVNVDWHSVRELFSALSRLKLGVNFGTLVGHSTIRRALIGEDRRDLTISELNVFKKVLVEALDDGAFGFSTGLGYAHSRQVPFAEIKELVSIVAKKNKLYTTHLRSEREGLFVAVEEALRIRKETSARTIVSHLRPLLGFEDDFMKSLDLIDREFSSNDIFFTNYPFDTSVVPIYTLLPVWAQEGGLEVMMSYIASSAVRDRIVKELKYFDGTNVVIARAPGLEYLIGKTLAEFATNEERKVPEALLELMILTKLKAVVFYRNIDLGLAVKSLMRKSALITANSAGLTDNKTMLTHERFTRTFPRFLELALRSRALTLEGAIQKLTSVPAGELQLKDRGLVKDGYFADLVLFSQKDRGVISIEHVFVNGQPVVENSVITGTAAGRVLTRT